MLHMDAISPPLPDRDQLVRDVLPRLGDGGTREHAEVAVTWALDRLAPRIIEWVTQRVVGRLVGVNEAAKMIGSTRAEVLRWSNGQGRTDFPAHVLSLDCGKHWDAAVLERFAQDQVVESSQRELTHADR